MTSGTEALYAAIMAICDPGDEVVLFEPFFPWYLPCVRLAGAVAKTVTLKEPEFKIDPDALRAAFSSKTKMVVCNSPHNPTGHVLSHDELELIASLCKQHDVIAVFDEVYETTLFSGAQHKRLCVVDGMAQRTLNIGSAGKIFNLTGWRIGWVTGPADLVAGCRAIHGYTTFSAATPLQAGIAAALDKESDGFYEDISAVFSANFAKLSAALQSLGYQVCCIDGEVGGYFLVADISSSGMDGMTFAKWLAKEKGVACVPLQVFYTPRANDPDWKCSLVRFAICKEPATIDTACAKLIQ
eukprot:m.166070 g.166070  ORF g.166070 m.166070 type:complete len:298 (+) comp18146_c1_seq1:913-1806(+)